VSAGGPLRLRPDAALNVGYQDRTPFGSPHGHGPELSVRNAFALLLDALEAGREPLAVTADPAGLLDQLAQQPAFGALTAPHPDGWQVRPEVLFPDPALNRPGLLTVARPDTDHVVRARLPRAFWPDTHDLIASLCGDGLHAEQRRRLRPELADMVALMERERLLEPAAEDGSGCGGGPDAEFVFVGHNTVSVRSARTTALVDPLLVARSVRNPSGYQPLQLSELGPPDVVAITHSHPDHFDPASLLRLPRSTIVVVPWIERESLLSVDLARRAGELGFEDVRALRWGERCTVGDLRITAYPFYGEQPTDGRWLHPEVRNVGCTYRIDTPTTSAMFLADSGRDHLGDTRQLALEARRSDGPVDVVFGGYRGWLTYPVQLLASSVARYFLFVPPDLWPCRMTMMATADMALDIAERWGAKVLVPYADGGAPWYSRLGLGPAFDDPASEVPGFDLFPERVLDAGRKRSAFGAGATIASPVSVVVLRPGQGLRCSERIEVVEVDEHRWPTLR
jgi:L-ascorbate metabolism protein UlaG (beta-lactamase superfamily)